MSIAIELRLSVACLIAVLFMCNSSASGQETKSPKGRGDCGNSSQPLVDASGKVIRILPKEMKRMAIKRFAPKFPIECRCSGTVLIEVIVNMEGKVECARGVSGHPLLRAYSIKAAYQWIFKPMAKDGKPVAFVGFLAFNFKSYPEVSL